MNGISQSLSVVMAATLLVSSVDASLILDSTNRERPSADYRDQALSLDANSALKKILIGYHGWRQAGRSVKTSGSAEQTWVPYQSAVGAPRLKEFETRYTSELDHQVLADLKSNGLLPLAISSAFDNSVTRLRQDPRAFTKIFSSFPATSDFRRQLRLAFSRFPEWTASAAVTMGSKMAVFVTFIDAHDEIQWGTFLDHHPVVLELHLYKLNDLWNAQRWIRLLKLPMKLIYVWHAPGLSEDFLLEQLPGLEPSHLRTRADDSPSTIRVGFDSESQAVDSVLQLQLSSFDLRYAPLPASQDAEDRARLLESLGIKSVHGFNVVLYGLSDDQLQEVQKLRRAATSSSAEFWIVVPGFPRQGRQRFYRLGGSSEPPPSYLNFEDTLRQVTAALSVADVTVMGPEADRLRAISQGRPLFELTRVPEADAHDSEKTWLVGMGAIEPVASTHLLEAIRELQTPITQRRSLLMVGTSRVSGLLNNKLMLSAAKLCAQLSLAAAIMALTSPSADAFVEPNRSSWLWPRVKFFAQGLRFLGIFVAAAMVDYGLFGSEENGDFASMVASFLILEIGGAISAGLLVQWMGRLKSASYETGHYDWAPVFRLVQFSVLFFFAVEGLIYGFLLPHLRSTEYIPAVVIQVFADVALLSPFITEPLATFLYVYVVHPKNEFLAVQEVREKNVAFFVLNTPIWTFFLTLAMLFKQHPLLSFGFIALGSLCWTIVFEHGDYSNSEVMLRKMREDPLANVLLKPLALLQSFFNSRWLRYYLLGLMSFFFVTSPTIYLLLMHVPPGGAGAFAVLLSTISAVAVYRKKHKAGVNWFGWEVRVHVEEPVDRPLQRQSA